MNFPPDPVLIARGKYSTLGKERREHLERVRRTAATILGLCQQAMNGVQAEVADTNAIEAMQAHVDSLKEDGKMIVSLGADMAILKPEAWPK
jgi:hypothetical protein